jgi:hypothetical protein
MIDASGKKFLSSLYQYVGNRREHVRVPFTCPLTLNYRNTRGELVTRPGYCVDVSERGIRIQSAEYIAPDTEVYVVLDDKQNRLRTFTSSRYIIANGSGFLIGLAFEDFRTTR